jgi:hypothetical protein
MQSRNNVRVDVESECDRRMPQTLADDFRWYTCLQGETGVSVPEVMEADRRHTGRSDMPLEPERHGVWVNKNPILASEDQTGIAPPGSPLKSLFTLTDAPTAQRCNRVGIESDAALASGTLWFTEHDVMVDRR